MPVVSNLIGGAQITASMATSRRFPIEFTAAGGASADSQAQLQVNTLPNCFWYVLVPLGGPINCTFTSRFAVDNLVVTTTPRFFSLQVATVLVPGTPFFVSERIAANVISGVLSVPAGAAVTIDIILSASL